MAEIIEARVKQKTGTEADFAGFTLLDGEMALVRSSANGPVVNFKVGPGLFDNLPWSLDYASIAANYKGNATPSTDPGTPAGPEFYTATEVGTYTNFGGIEVEASDAFVLLSYDGANWSKAVANIDLSGYATKAELDQTDETLSGLQSEISNFSYPGKNLIDKSKIIGGSYYSSGSNSIVSDTDWRRTSPIPVTEGQILSTSGNGPGGGRGGFFDIDLNPLQATGPSPFTVPAGAAYVIVNVTNTGENDITYDDTIQLEIGPTPTAYEPYLVKLKYDNLDEKPVIDEAISTLNAWSLQSRNLIDKSLMLSGNYSPVNGNVSPSNNWIRTPHIAISENTQYTLSGYDDVNIASARFVFFDSAGTFISSVMSEGVGITTPVTVTSPPGAAFIGINVANVIDIGLNPTDNQYANSVQFELGDTATAYQPFGLLINADKLSDESAFVEFAPTYYKYDPAGGEGNGAFTVYSRMGSTDFYVGFEIRHQINAADTIFLDYWRLYDAWVYKYQDGGMLITPHRALTAGENECVYRTPNSLDFTGGFHGNEKTIPGKVWFYADGIEVSTAGAIDLTPCNEFQYREQSNMHEAPTSGGVVNPAHPVQAIHDKITTIKEAGYKTFNRLSWQESLTIQLYYHGISCIGKAFSEKVMNEFLTEATMVGGNARFLEVVGARDYYGTNAANLLSVQVTSKLIKPADLDTQCEMFVWDRSADSKYYRQLPDDETVVNGDVYESEMTVSFKKL